MNINDKLFREAKKYIAGGVNSPVRSFLAVGGAPIFIRRAKGSKLYGADGRSYVDYCQSWGATILGHAHPAVVARLLQAISRGTSFGAPTEDETVLAKKIKDALPSMELMRFVNSGTEAVMSALRVARGYTNKKKVIKFRESYHGHADSLLSKSDGVPGEFLMHTVEAAYNDLHSVKAAVGRHNGGIAAILVEPVCGNYGVILPKDGFLAGLRAIADRCGAVLIFDEVITGFRISREGAQGYFGVTPDITCLGKIAGGGLPFGVYGGRREIMRKVAPLGEVYQAGTLAGNPIAVNAGIAMLDELSKDGIYDILEEKTEGLCDGLRRESKRAGADLNVVNISSIFSVSLEGGKFKKFFHALLRKGIYISPSPFESCFLSLAHTKGDIDRTLEAVRLALE